MLGSISGAAAYRVYIQPAGIENSPSPPKTGSAPSENSGPPSGGVTFAQGNSGVQSKPDKDIGPKECQTCKSRKYVDVSNDPSVSFQSPTQIAPQAAASAVSAHEGQHVSHEQAKASEEGRVVISQSVQIFTGICPECGKTYVSGGRTTTITAAKEDPEKTMGLGRKVDVRT